MIRSLEVHNFRRFKHAALEKCARVNIIVGKNATGKTSLLEAIFLVLGSNIQSVVTLRQWRGFDGAPGAVMQGTMSHIHELMWRDLFHDYGGSKPIKITCKGDTEQDRELSISPVNPTVRLDVNSKSPVVSKNAGVKFAWKAKGQPDFEATPVLTPQGFQIPLGPEPPAEVFLFAANQTYSALECSNRFSTLSRKGTIKPFVEMFKSRYPQIEDLSIELYGSMPALFVKVKEIQEKIPLSLLSGGINKLAAILLAIASAPKSVVLIDEIENGLYYQDLPDIWTTLLDFANRFECQIFASTHSGECLTAASIVARKNLEAFAVIQAANGKLNQFPGDKFVWAFDEEIEIR